MNLPEHIFNKTMFEPNTGCWIWTGAKGKSGYGNIGINKKTYSIHRIVYEIEKGQIPIGYQIDHLCNNKICINPYHLEAKTPKENIIRALKISKNHHMNKTHCKRGHEFTKENIYFNQNVNGRICKICRRLHDKIRNSKRRVSH